MTFFILIRSSTSFVLFATESDRVCIRDESYVNKIKKYLFFMISSWEYYRWICGASGNTRMWFWSLINNHGIYLINSFSLLNFSVRVWYVCSSEIPTFSIISDTFNRRSYKKYCIPFFTIFSIIAVLVSSITLVIFQIGITAFKFCYSFLYCDIHMMMYYQSIHFSFC